MTGAVISAAGHQSSIAQFQPMLTVGNTTVIKRIIITLQRAGVSPIVVVTGRYGQELEKHISKMRVICLRNEEYELTQMFDSVSMGLSYIEDLCDRVLVMPTKAPLFLEGSIKRLLEGQGDIVRPVCDERKGHPVLLDCKWIPKIISYTGTDGLRGALRQPGIQEVTELVAVEDQGIIFAVETEEDCGRALSLQAHERIQLHSKVQVYLEREEAFFGPGIAQFLTLICHTQSMQTACRQMHMSYSKGWKILKAAEKQLGYPLLITQSGGVDGGFSQLTPKTLDFLNRFLAMENEMNQEAERLFDKYFKEEI